MEPGCNKFEVIVPNWSNTVTVTELDRTPPPSSCVLFGALEQRTVLNSWISVILDVLKALPDIAV